jgi:manganese oxidase
LKVRKNQQPNNYRNTEWFKQPEGTQAYEWKGEALAVKRSQSAGSSAMNRVHSNTEVDINVRKPAHFSNHNH